MSLNYEVYNRDTGKMIIITKEMLEALKPSEDYYIIKQVTQAQREYNNRLLRGEA